MATREIAVGDAIACRDQKTGQAGVLHVETDRIWVEFVGFGARPCVKADGPIHLHTAKGWVVSLFDNVEVSPVMPSWRRGEVGTIYHQRILSNLALAGETAWLADDLVQSAFFRLTPDCDFLWPKDRAAEIAEIPVDRSPDRTIFTTPVSWGEVSLILGLEGDPIRDKWTPKEAGFKLSFCDGTTPDQCLDRICHLERLFVLLTWRHIRGAGVSIRRTDADERSYSHRVLSAEPKDAQESRDAQTIRPTPLSSDDEAERNVFQAVLRAWIEKGTDWRDASRLMRAASQRFRNVSAERALDACRWHESLERSREKAEAPGGMRKVIEAAISQARECGLEDYVEWIKGRLSGIRGEPQKLLFPRLMREVNERLGHNFFDEVSVEMATGAYKARNATGHGVMGSLSNAGVRKLWGNILAMETLCAARMISELPLSESGRKLLDMHPLFRAFVELRNERRKSDASASSDV